MDWSAPVSDDQMRCRTRGRIQYNARRQLLAQQRRDRLVELMLADGGPAWGRGRVTYYARQLGVSRPTIDRDLRALLAIESRCRCCGRRLDTLDAAHILAQDAPPAPARRLAVAEAPIAPLAAQITAVSTPPEREEQRDARRMAWLQRHGPALAAQAQQGYAADGPGALLVADAATTTDDLASVQYVSARLVQSTGHSWPSVEVAR